jgi:hypothetical protein
MTCRRESRGNWFIEGKLANENEQWRKLQQQLLHCSVGINLLDDSEIDLMGFNCPSK